MKLVHVDISTKKFPTVYYDTCKVCKHHFFFFIRDYVRFFKEKEILVQEHQDHLVECWIKKQVAFKVEQIKEKRRWTPTNSNSK